MKIILVVIMLCGQPDTFIVQFPNGKQVETNEITAETLSTVYEIMKKKPRIVVWEYPDICT